MTKFYVGQKVLVRGSTFAPQSWTKEMVGNVCEVAFYAGHQVAVFTPDKSDCWFFFPSDLQPITETLTVNGVGYIRKHEPAHEWKFGDVAVHDEYGVGIVTDAGTRLEFTYANGQELIYLNRSELTFLRRADLSV